MVLFAFSGSAVFSLRLSVVFSFPGQPAWVAAVSLPSEAGSADTEYQPAPSAANFDQEQNGHPSGIANSRKMQ